MTFVITQGDTAPEFEKRLRKDDGSPVDLSNYNEVAIHIRDSNLNVTVDDNTSNNVNVNDSQTGKVSYSWQSGDTDDIGSYEAEFVVTFSDGSEQSFPVGSKYDIEVIEDIS